MIRTPPLWLLWGLTIVLSVLGVVLAVGLLVQGLLLERRLVRDLDGLHEAFAACGSPVGE